MSAGRIYAIVLRQFYLTRDNPTRQVLIFLWPLLDIVLWGFLSTYLGKFTGLNTIAIFLGAIILWDFLIRVMNGVVVAFFEDVWSRNFVNIFASPLTVGEYLSGMVIASIITSAVGFVAMLLSASVLFGFSIFVYGLFALPFILILFLSGVALGIFGVALVLRYGPAAEWFIWPMPAIAAPFVGVFYPIETLPAWMQTIAYALPPTYVFEGLRAVVENREFAFQSIVWGALLSALCIAFAYAFFLHTYRRAIRTGLIARYSAETVS